MTQVGFISAAPLSGVLRTVPFSVEDQPSDDRNRPSANLRVISPSYPVAAGTRLLEGRLLSDLDRADTPRVALVSAALADRILSGRAVGRRLLINDNNQGPRPVEIVGILENVRHTALDLPPAFDGYIPLPQAHSDGVPLLRNNHFWMVRLDMQPAAFHATFVSDLRAVDPDAALSDTGQMRQLVDAWLGPRRFTLGLFGAFALTAVLLAIVGLYGLVSYTVSQRAPEIGLRMALGATPGDVHRMILGQAARLGVGGVAAGVALAGAVQSLIPGVQDVRLDPAVIVVMASCLIGIALIAAWRPARRAARIDPTLSLRKM